MTLTSRSEAPSLRITEIFHSLQGESSLTGYPTVFVRLTGCPLRCVYCDTDYAFHGGTRQSVAQILDTVCGYGARYVCVTGGEPLAQPAVHELLVALCDAGYVVSLETSGALPIAAVDARVRRIVDIKTPASGEVHRNEWANLALLTAHDEVKFVICDRGDYDWAVFKLRETGLDERDAQVLFSPSQGQLEPAVLAAWILEDQLRVRMQLQLHKIIWGNEPGR
ncbi:MAG: 7-carboxy-7-deazaguanine synthase QueE [Pseudomonadales bacterium]|nr:7-carboxy-7-deazaguanine synthase QueE [Pseudomonadales bacterium]